MLVSSSIIADSSTEEITRTWTTSSPSHRVLLRFVAMDTGSARMLVAAEGIGPESEEVAADDVVNPLLSVDDSDPLLSVAQDSQEPDEVIVVLVANGMVPDS